MARSTLGCALLLVVAALVCCADAQNLTSPVFGMAEYRAFFGTRVAPICTPINLRTVAACSNWLGLYCAQVNVCTAPLAARVQFLEQQRIPSLERRATALEKDLAETKTRFNNLVTTLEAANATLMGTIGNIGGSLTGLIDLITFYAGWATTPGLLNYFFEEEIKTGDNLAHVGKMRGNMMFYRVSLPSPPSSNKGKELLALPQAPVAATTPSILWHLEVNIQITEDTVTTDAITNVKWGAMTNGKFTEIVPVLVSPTDTDEGFTTPDVYCAVSHLLMTAGSPQLAYFARFTRNDIQLEARAITDGTLIKNAPYPKGTTITCRTMVYADNPPLI